MKTEIDVTNKILLKTIQEIVNSAISDPNKIESIEIKKVVSDETKDVAINLHVNRIDSGEKSFSIKTGDKFGFNIK